MVPDQVGGDAKQPWRGFVTVRLERRPPGEGHREDLGREVACEVGTDPAREVAVHPPEMAVEDHVEPVRRRARGGDQLAVRRIQDPNHPHIPILSEPAPAVLARPSLAPAQPGGTVPRWRNWRSASGGPWAIAYPGSRS